MFTNLHVAILIAFGGDVAIIITRGKRLLSSSHHADEWWSRILLSPRRPPDGEFWKHQGSAVNINERKTMRMNGCYGIEVVFTIFSLVSMMVMVLCSTHHSDEICLQKRIDLLWWIIWKSYQTAGLLVDWQRFHCRCNGISVRGTKNLHRW